MFLNGDFREVSYEKIMLMAEIRRSPVEGKVVEIPLFTLFSLHPRWLGMGFLPSTVSSRIGVLDI